MSPPVRARLPLLAAALYVAVLVWQAPHTVHHFFEPEAEKQNECALGAAAERSTGTTVDGVGIVAVAGIELPAVALAPELFARPARSVLGPRAPPSPA